MKQLAWKLLQAAVAIYVALYVYQHNWGDSPGISLILGIVFGILAAAALTAIVHEACLPRAWPIRTTQLLVLLGVSIVGWKQNPILAVIVGLLTALAITATIDMTGALVARIRQASRSLRARRRTSSASPQLAAKGSLRRSVSCATAGLLIAIALSVTAYAIETDWVAPMMLCSRTRASSLIFDHPPAVAPAPPVSRTNYPRRSR
jgi:hypothetical protein